MDTAIIQIAVQVPALAFVSIVFLRVLNLVLDIQGKKIDRLADAIEAELRSRR